MAQDRLSTAPLPPAQPGPGALGLAAAACPEVGLRRVSWVRIVFSDGEPVCEVAGIGHRVPAIRRIPLSTAAALAAAGVPTVVRNASTAAPAGH